jgi:hypothetical protein
VTASISLHPAALVAAALDLADRGIPVFPCNATKRPTTEHGHLDASIDPATIRRMFANPLARHIGIPTGEQSGIDVLDIDPRKGGDAWLAANEHRLPPTRRHGSLSGGWHILFRYGPHRLRSSNDRLAPGVDLKTDGGYAVWWPASGLAVTGPEPIDWPADLVDEIASRTGRRALGEVGPDVAGLAAPSAAALVRLLDELPNPIAATRTDWAEIMLAAAGALAGLRQAGELADGDEAAIEAAAVGWACRWPGCEDPEAERAKWESDWVQRTEYRSGWYRLLAAAKRAGLSAFAIEDAQADFAALQPEPGEAGMPVPSAAPAPRLTGLRVLTLAECDRSESRGYVIKGMLAPRDVACIFGAPGAGKSLLAPRLAHAVATGSPAFGQRTRQGTVLYIAAEDPTGMRGRLSALRQACGDTDRLLLVEGVGNLLTEGGDERKALVAVVAEHKPALIIIDTLAMAFPGLEENSAEGMGRVVAVARGLTRGGAAVVLIHHDTKASDGTPRGHSLFNGALDMSLHLDPQDEHRIVRGKLMKNRNGPCDLSLAFRIGVQDRGEDEDGDPILLPYAVEIDTPPPAARKPLPPIAKLALETLRTITATVEEVAPNGAGMVTMWAWKAACYERGVSAADTVDSKRMAVKRAIERLVQDGEVIVRAPHVWLKRPTVEDFDVAEKTTNPGTEHPEHSPNSSELFAEAEPDKTNSVRGEYTPSGYSRTVRSAAGVPFGEETGAFEDLLK